MLPEHIKDGVATIKLAPDDLSKLDDPFFHARIAAWDNIVKDVRIVTVGPNGCTVPLITISPSQSRKYTQARMRDMLNLCEEFTSAINFFAESRDPSVVTNHQNHGFVMANPFYRMDIEVVPPSEMYGVKHSEPFVWNGRTIDAHWGYQPQRLVDLVTALNQDKQVENFKYRSINPNGQIIEWTMDYRLFDIKDQALRISRHRNIEVVGTIA